MKENATEIKKRERISMTLKRKKEGRNLFILHRRHNLDVLIQHQ
jgi:hypothetical protein